MRLTVGTDGRAAIESLGTGVHSVVAAPVRADTQYALLSISEPEVGGETSDAAHLTAIIEGLPVVLLRVATDGTLLAANEAALAAVGAEKLEQVLGKSFTAFLPSEDSGNFLIQAERAASRHCGSVEVTLTRLTGTTHTMDAHVVPHPGSPDDIKSVLITLRDVTESRRLERSVVEAMSRQGERDSAHESERARLAAELEQAQQAHAGAEASSAQLAAMAQRVDTLEAERATALQEAETSFVRAAALVQRVDALEAERAEAAERAESVGRQVAELEQALAGLNETSTHRAAELERHLAAVREEANRLAKAKQDAEQLNAARLAGLESVLASTATAERTAATRLHEMARAVEGAARQFLELSTSIDSVSGTTAGALGSRIEKALAEVVGKQSSLSVAVAAPDSLIDAPAEAIERALVLLAVNRSAVIHDAQILIEIADVVLDDDAARGRGGMTAGEYALVAMHVAGDHVAERLPLDLFESADKSAWEHAGASFSAAAECVRSVRGALWLSHEGEVGVVFELYVARRPERGA